ncbi:MAG: GNAT family N-acetyltransferase [Candidatus Helarchaeota archaeon]
MDIDIKILTDPLPHEQISKLYEKTYVADYFESGANDWASVEYTDWYFGAYHHDKRFFFSAWKGEQLIATLFGTPNTLKIGNEIEINAISLGLAATDPAYKRQGIQKRLLNALIDKAKSTEIDFIYAFPEKGFGGNELLKKHFNFKRYMKNQQHFIKVMGDYGRKILQDYRGLNVVLAKLLKIYAGIPNNKLQGGALREGTPADIPEITRIFNSYQSRVQISQVWTEDHVKEELEGASRMNEILQKPYKFHWKIWERDGQILGTLYIRLEMIHFKKGSAPVALMSETCFHENTTVEERAGVIATLVRWIRDTYPDVFTVQTTQPQYELKAYKSLKFIDDTSTYEFLGFPITDKGTDAINRYPKYKEIFMPYHR